MRSLAGARQRNVELPPVLGELRTSRPPERQATFFESKHQREVELERLARHRGDVRATDRPADHPT